MRIFVSLIVVFFYVTSSFSQSPNITFKHLTTDDGLSQFSVNSLYMDEDGMIWIATREGLNKYDGNNITTYKLRKNDPYSLFNNTVLRITGNQKGKIYLLCTDGIAEFDLVSERFKTLMQDNINAIYFNEKLYIGKNNEIYTYNNKTNNFDYFYRLPGNNIIITSLYLDHNKKLWIGTKKSGVYTLDENKKINHTIEKGHIASFYCDSKLNLWVSTWEQGLFKIDKENNISNLKSDKNKNSLSSNFVRSCCEDNNGYLWIGTFNGLNRYNPKTNHFTNYEANSNPTSLTHSSIWSIIKDKQGTLWVGTYFGGVNYFNPEYEIYTQYKATKNPSKGLSSPIVGKMTQDKNNNLWICTEGGGVNVYNPTTKKFKWYTHKNGINSISHNNVKAIYYDEERSTMWIGTHLGGLNKLDLRTNRFTIYKHQEGNLESLPSDIIRDIQPYKESLVIATQNGVALFDIKTGKAKQLFKNSNEGKGIKMVSALCFDKNGLLWIAATGKGVYAYDFTTNQLKRYSHNPNKATSLSNNNINTITSDSHGNLWFSTSGSGLDLYDPQTDSFVNFDMQKNGLASDCIYDIEESTINSDHLWVITNQGFSLFDKAEEKFTNYNKANGFPLSAINENALYISKDGTVYLGGIDGMISFNEKSLNFTPKPYNILFSKLIINGKEIRPNDQSGVLEKSISYTKKITLKANQSIFSIGFTTSNFIPANKGDILYQLKGFSDKWNRVYKMQELITYTNLNPGEYTLYIKSSLPEVGKAQLKIIVLPPWYKTWWAFLIYAVALVAITITLIKNYKTKIRLHESLKFEQKHIENIEKLNQSKLKFFTNISHEFRTPLTLIIGQIENLLQNQTFSPSAYNKILSIYKNGIQLRELINELLDFRKQEQGLMKIKVAERNIINFLYENWLIFNEYANSKNIKFNFIKSKDNIAIWYDERQMQKVINNLLSNAFKHTQEENEISLEIDENDDYAIIKISDTGSGIDQKELDKIFDRFYQTEQLNSLNTGAGTGIGLALTKGIVELHHGKITVESKINKGTCFTIYIPKGKKHFSDEEIIKEGEEALAEPVVKLEQNNYNCENSINYELLKDQKEEDKNLNAKMIIVEDNDSIKEMLSNILSTFYDIRTASNGEEALALIQEEMPDIVLSDVVMPKMSGTELCKKIKSEIDTCHIPVILLTARTAIEHNIEGLKIGADDYITKPFNINLLISRCNNLVNSRRMLQEKFSKQPQAYVQMLATNSMDKELLDRAMNVIEENIDNSEFNVNTFAREMGIARTNLFTKLKAITGQTPNEFILNIRLKKAAILLRNNLEYNITEISERVGFSSSRYFSKCFKETYNISPLAYRKGENPSNV